MRRMRWLVGALAAGGIGLGLAMPAAAEISDKLVRIGVLTDLSGVYSESTGQGSVIAARLAVEDFKREWKDIAVDIVVADHQNKADIGSALARRWLDIDKVDAIVDVPNSAVAFGVNEVLRGSRATLLASTPASPDLHGKACSPNMLQWLHDTRAVANSMVAGIAPDGGSSWFFITSDYALGHSLERDATEVIRARGGQVVGAVRHPLNTSDFSSFLLQAQSSSAKVVVLANAGADTLTAIKQANEFMITGKTLATFILFINDVHALGLETAKGLLSTEAFYWDLDDRTRAFGRRFAQQAGGKMPTSNQAGVYSAVLSYLKSVAATGSDEAATVMAELKRKPIQDPLFGEVTVRPDGQAVHKMYLFRIKQPSQSAGPWDYYEPVRALSADEAFPPMRPGECPMLARN